MARYQGQNKKGTPFDMNLKSFVPCQFPRHQDVLGFLEKKELRESYFGRASIKPETWNIPQYSGTFRNIPEYPGT